MDIINVVLLFYLLIGANYLGDLYSGQTRDFIKSNIYIKHLIALSIILIITRYVTNVYDPQKLIIYSIAAYLLFILSTKLDLIWNILVICLLIVYFLIDTKFKQNNDNIQIDQSLSIVQKETMINNMNQLKSIIIYCVIVTILIGGIFYLDKKANKFTENFDVAKYVFYPRQS